MTIQELIENINARLSGNKMSTEELYQWERTVAQMISYEFDDVPYFTTDDTGKISL